MENYNVLNAFLSLVSNPEVTVNPAKISNNRINNVGDALEIHIKDALAGLLGCHKSNAERDQIYAQVFSWLGNAGNPPDCMIRNGDAFEVKKILNRTHGAIALNSSYPKSKLYSSDTRITQGARTAELWQTRDIVYVVGSVDSSDELKRLWFIYGDCYAASKEVYERLITSLTKGVTSTPDVDFQVTNELGKVKKVDPLGITDMRIRGMWNIATPSSLYSDLVKSEGKRQFYLLMREEKYNSFPVSDRQALESFPDDRFSNSLIGIRDPDNPASIISARFLKYEI